MHLVHLQGTGPLTFYAHVGEAGGESNSEAMGEERRDEQGVVSYVGRQYVAFAVASLQDQGSSPKGFFLLLMSSRSIFSHLLL